MSRIARLYRWPIAIGVVILAALAVQAWLTLPGSGRAVHGSGPTGSQVTITGEATGTDLDVSTNGSGPPARCSATGDGNYFFTDDPQDERRTFDYQGTRWYRVGTLGKTWTSGGAVTCPTSLGTQVLLSADTAGTQRSKAITLTAGALLGAVVTGGFFVIGRRRTGPAVTR